MILGELPFSGNTEVRNTNGKTLLLSNGICGDMPFDIAFREVVDIHAEPDGWLIVEVE